jgi:hypothetical protein
MVYATSGSASESASRLYYFLPHACTAVPLTLLLAGCLETANAVKHAEAERVAAQRTPSRTADESPAPAAYSEAFWTALADLDLVATRHAARSRSEVRFAEGVSALVAGDERRAEDAFSEVSVDETDPNVATAAQLMFAATLMYEHKWSALSGFTTATQRSATGHPGLAGMEKLGEVFANVEHQAIDFPARRITLPLGITALGTPTVRVRIRGKNYQFWLDTGSSLTVLSSRVAKEAGASVLGQDTLTIATFAGVAPARPTVLPRMEIGSIVIRNSPAIVIESDLMRVQGSASVVPWSGLPVDGIIGWDIIRRFDMSLDYASGKITFAKPTDLGTSGTPAQNLKWVGKPFIQLRTESGVVLHLTLDTGAQGSFLNSAVLKKADVVPMSSTTRSYGIARTGGQATRAVAVLSVEVGGKSLRLKDLIVYNPTPSGLFNCDGILGSDIAQFGTIRIDATNGLFAVG